MGMFTRTTAIAGYQDRNDVAARLFENIYETLSADAKAAARIAMGNYGFPVDTSGRLRTQEPRESMFAIQYAQQLIDRLDEMTLKAPVTAATTAAITLSGVQVVDSVQLAVGDRVLVKNQASAIANGIYVVASGAWTRATDWDTSSDPILAGTTVPVYSGAANQGAFWQLDAEVTVVGTDPATLTRLS